MIFIRIDNNIKIFEQFYCVNLIVSYMFQLSFPYFVSQDLYCNLYRSVLTEKKFSCEIKNIYTVTAFFL